MADKLRGAGGTERPIAEVEFWIDRAPAVVASSRVVVQKHNVIM